MIDRILQDTITTIQITFTVDGVPIDPAPATATIQVTRDDGTDVVSAGSAATRTGVGVFTYQLSTTHTAQLDWLTATWTATLNGAPQTITSRLEIVGGFLFSLAQARRDQDLDDPSKYPNERLTEARTYAEQELEQACGVAFVPRYIREPVRPTRSGEVMLRPRVRALRAVTRAGVALTDAATLTWDPIGTLSLTAGLVPAATAGSAAIDVAYEHGYDQPPAAVSQAALIVAKDYLVRGPMDDRAIQRATEEGPVFIATPGFQGKRFGIPTVDAVVGAYGMPALVG